MDFFSKKGRKGERKPGIFGKKASSHSTPPSPARVNGERSPPPYYYHSNKRAESEYAFPSSDERNGYLWKQPASERVPSSYTKPPIFVNAKPDRHRDHGKQTIEVNYEAEAQTTPINSAPQSPTNNRWPPPNAASKEKANSENSDDDFSFSEDQSVYLYPEIAPSYQSRPVSGSSTPVHYKFQIQREHEEYEKHNEPPELPDESQSFSLLEIEKMRGIKHYDKEETQSVISEPCVSVGIYKVRLSVSSTLQSILDKYGDIASGSKLQSLSTRSYYLECLSSSVLELKSTPLKELTETRVKEILAIVKDMESVKIDVSWLISFLNELSEAVEYCSQHEVAKVEKEICESDLEIAREEMEVQMKELGLKEKEIRICREKVTEYGAKLGNLEMKSSRLNKNLVFLKSKVDKFDGEAVMGELER